MAVALKKISVVRLAFLKKHPKQVKPATDWEAEIDKIWREASQEMDKAKRKALYFRWQEIAAEQQPLIFTDVLERETAVRNHFGNAKPARYGSIFWNVEEIFDRNATRTAP